MNILYINHYAGSVDMGMEFRPYYLAREWVKMGHKVTIVAGDYSHLRKNNPSVQRDFQTERIDGIEYVWIRSGAYSGNGAKRAISMVRFVGKLYLHARKIAKTWKPDIVIASSTYPLDTYPAYRIARLAGAKYVHEVHDMWPATLYEVGGMSRNHPFVILMGIAEKAAYKHCDHCVSLLPYAKSYMVEHGLAPDKFVVVSNGVNLAEWENPAGVSEPYHSFFQQHKDDFIVGYVGGHAKSNALDYALRVAKRFEADHKDIIFVLVGDGVEKPGLMERAKKENQQNVFFLPAIPKKEVPDLLRHFDCSYMTGADSPLYRFGLCLNKLYDSMMAGVPIVCAFHAPDTPVITYGCGFQTDPADEDSVVSDILNVYRMSRKERDEMGARGEAAIRANFTYDRLANIFLEKVGQE